MMRMRHSKDPAATGMIEPRICACAFRRGFQIAPAQGRPDEIGPFDGVGHSRAMKTDNALDGLIGPVFRLPGDAALQRNPCKAEHGLGYDVMV